MATLNCETHATNCCIQCFTDYSVIRQSQFLSVPLCIFEVFKNEREQANVIEVLLILALFCTGDVRDQLMFCFELFDDDQSDSMDVEEMTNFLWVLATASHKVCPALSSTAASC